MLLGGALRGCARHEETIRRQFPTVLMGAPMALLVSARVALATGFSWEFISVVYGNRLGNQNYGAGCAVIGTDGNWRQSLDREGPLSGISRQLNRGWRWLSTRFFGVQPGDPLTFAAVGILMLRAALVACGIPAARAVAVEPAAILRNQWEDWDADACFIDDTGGFGSSRRGEAIGWLGFRSAVGRPR